MLEVDQTPIGKTPRSCPATYIGFWDAIRKLFTETLEAKARGYAAARFSFNTGEGRCPGCEGQGVKTIAMSFLPDVKVPCDVCHGARFNPETLAVSWRGKSIGDVLRMEVDEAVDFFASMPAIAHPLQLLKDVGLGYLTLGQPSPTLSGGEAQRIKLVTELSKVRDDVTRRGKARRTRCTCWTSPPWACTWPTCEKLIRVLHRLVDGGHSVVVIEHDLDVIAEADWVIDLGPEGGAGGGRVVVGRHARGGGGGGLAHRARRWRRCWRARRAGHRPTLGASTVGQAPQPGQLVRVGRTGVAAARHQAQRPRLQQRGVVVVAAAVEHVADAQQGGRFPSRIGDAAGQRDGLEGVVAGAFACCAAGARALCLLRLRQLHRRLAQLAQQIDDVVGGAGAACPAQRGFVIGLGAGHRASGRGNRPRRGPARG